jgi:hypothetical protein
VPPLVALAKVARDGPNECAHSCERRGLSTEWIREGDARAGKQTTQMKEPESQGVLTVQARISRWILGATLVTTLALGGATFTVMPAHAQSFNGLGQAGPQFSKCQFATLDDGTCGASSHEGAGTRWQLSNPVAEPAIGLVPAPCRRGPEN